MGFWALMTITILSGDLDGVMFQIPYQTKEQCEAAKAAVSDTLIYDHSIDCVPTSRPSGTVRPKRNPFIGGAQNG